MAVKPRTVWFNDEEWAILKRVAADRGGTISSIIRDFWIIAADPRPAAAAFEDPTHPYLGPSFGKVEGSLGAAAAVQGVEKSAAPGFGFSRPAPKPVKKGE